MPNFISAEAKDLIKRILTTDPEKRITIEEIKTHPWFNLEK
jgi:serine/threonine protein kinase